MVEWRSRIETTFYESQVMGREIEIKIPLSDFEYDKIFSVISGDEQLTGLTVNDKPVHILKSDEYYSLYQTRAESKSKGEPQVIRIRSENSSEDPAKQNSYFCIKRKSIENGIELNRENETFVENADVIRDLLNFSGYIKFFEKKKDAWSVHCKATVLAGADFHLELEIVNNLKYVEIEVTEEGQPADTVRSALEKFVALFGLDSSKRDSRSWMEIINGSAE